VADGPLPTGSGGPGPSGPLIGSSELLALLRQASPLSLLDVRWELGAGPRRDEFLAGHVPGARFVDLEAELAAPGTGPGGRHPLPDPAAFGAAMRRHGVRSDRPVVVYDDWGGLPAARAWWQLRDAGHPDVRVLDGGLAAYRRAHGPLSHGVEPDPEPGDFVPQPGGLPRLDAAAAAALAAGVGTLLDVRAPERFRGEQEPVDPVAGHIPGARNLPDAALRRDDGLLRTPEEIRALALAAGVEAAAPVGVYCGSGITAAHTVLALLSAGLPAALYAGSWSDWISDPRRPVAVGP
jgi:thiosulfate/3-mercaptopyruvate sulfurtransferase